MELESEDVLPDNIIVIGHLNSQDKLECPVCKAEAHYVIVYKHEWSAVKVRCGCCKKYVMQLEED